MTTVEEALESSPPPMGVKAANDLWVQPRLNNRAKHIYSLRPEVINEYPTRLKVEGEKQYPALFMEAMIEAPGTATVDFQPYVSKLASLFNHCVKENVVDFGILAPMSIMEMVSIDREHNRSCRFVNGKWQMAILSMPDERIQELMKLPFNPEFITQRWIMFLFTFPSTRVIDIAGTTDYQVILDTAHNLAGMKNIFFREGELPNNSDIWGKLH